MTTPGPPYPPTTGLVARAWLALVLPDAVRVGDALPAPDAALRTVGFVRTDTTGGGVDLYVPMNHPIVSAECWVAPPKDGSSLVPWNAAERLAGWVIAATYAPAFMGVVVDLTPFGAYAPARVHTVNALSVPRKGPDDPGNYARFDIDLDITWTGA